MQDAIIKAGGVPPLLNLVRLGSQLAQENATRAVWHLCAATVNQGVIVHAGAIADLVALSKTGSAKGAELAAAVISDLAKGAIAEREQMKLGDGSANGDGEHQHRTAMGPVHWRGGRQT